MRFPFAVFFLVFGFSVQAQAFLDSNCEIYWSAYTLEKTAGSRIFASSASGVLGAAGTRSGKTGNELAREQADASRFLLIALTLVPPPGQYLYGPESSEGLPTTMEVEYAPLTAFPMARMNSGQMTAVLAEKGTTLAVRAPTPVLKKDSPFARTVLPGSENSNPPIYPGPVTFWTVLPAETSRLGGAALRATMSGLLCSANSCTPASGNLELTLSAKEMAAFPPVEQESWWAAFQEGENVYLPPPETALTEAFSPREAPDSGPKDVAAEEEKEGAENLARHAAFFATFEPSFFHPNLEVGFLGEALLFGLAAGLLLNLMPCVLPVISLKFSALLAVSSMTNKRRQVHAFRMHCFLFALGVMTWFIVLALLLGVAGWAWGEIFQRPLVIVALGFILFILGLSLFGVFPLPVFDLKVSSDRHPRWQAFASGLLATLLATPCSGPLLGGVLAWAIRQPLPALVLTVASVGCGMSLPYCLLAACPRLVHLLPRPGSWTLRLEQLLGFFLMGTVVYLATLLPDDWITPFLFNLFAIAFAAWLWGQIGHLRASRLRRALAHSLAVLVVFLAVLAGGYSVQSDTSWENFDPQTFTEMLGKEPILLEFTADWCPSCKALEYTTLNKTRMADLRRRYNVRTIRVDLTRKNTFDVGAELLKALDSTSIPVLALFPAGENSRQPVVLRDLVTPAQLEEAAFAAFARAEGEKFGQMLSLKENSNEAGQRLPLDFISR
jgi:thiol:disulfide interchange protein DsbD